VVDQQGFQRLAEVLDQVQPIHHLHGLGRPPAHTVGVELAPVAAALHNKSILDSFFGSFTICNYQ
jgi:hypothetical protein